MRRRESCGVCRFSLIFWDGYFVAGGDAIGENEFRRSRREKKKKSGASALEKIK